MLNQQLAYGLKQKDNQDGENDEAQTSGLVPATLHVSSSGSHLNLKHAAVARTLLAHCTRMMCVYIYI